MAREAMGALFCGGQSHGWLGHVYRKTAHDHTMSYLNYDRNYPESNGLFEDWAPTLRSGKALVLKVIHQLAQFHNF